MILEEEKLTEEEINFILNRFIKDHESKVKGHEIFKKFRDGEDLTKEAEEIPVIKTAIMVAKMLGTSLKEDEEVKEIIKKGEEEISLLSKIITKLSVLKLELV